MWQHLQIEMSPVHVADAIEAGALLLVMKSVIVLILCRSGIAMVSVSSKYSLDYNSQIFYCLLFGSYSVTILSAI